MLLALVSHIRVHFPDQYKIYLDLKTSGRSPTLGEVRIAQGLATSQEVDQQLKAIQEKEDALLAALSSVSRSCTMRHEAASDT